MSEFWSIWSNREGLVDTVWWRGYTTTQVLNLDVMSLLRLGYFMILLRL